MESFEQGLNINQIIRYGYTGGLLFLSSVILELAKTTKIIATLGNIISPIVLIAAGAVFYIFYRAAFGDIIDGIHILVHEMQINRRTEYLSMRSKCTLRHIQDKFNVSTGDCLNIYRIVRDNLYTEKLTSQITFQRSEIHLIYLSSVISLFSMLYSLVFKNGIHYWSLFSVFIISLYLGLRLDTIICSMEYPYFEHLNKGQIDNLL